MNLPHPQCYWVKPGQLLAGEYPRNLDHVDSSPKLQAILDAGVTLFMDLTEKGELDPYDQWLDGIEHIRTPIRDMGTPSVERMHQILDVIDKTLAEDKMVYVHCWGGIGRTGTVVGCWLKRHDVRGMEHGAWSKVEPGGGVEHEEDPGLLELKRLWKACAKSAYCDSPQTPAQLQFVCDWKAGQ